MILRPKKAGSSMLSHIYVVTPEIGNDNIFHHGQYLMNRLNMDQDRMLELDTQVNLVLFETSFTVLFPATA